MKIIKWGIIFCIVVILMFVLMTMYNTTGSKPIIHAEAFRTGEVTIILFHAKWCGHCKEYLKSSIFLEFGKNLPAKTTTRMIDVDEDKEMAEKYNITSMPTIIGINSSTGELIKEFKGDRYQVSELVAFSTECIESIRYK